MESDSDSDQVSFWRNENTLELDSSDGYTTDDSTKNLC